MVIQVNALADLDWKTYQAIVTAPQSVIFLPIGALEQHGPHMSMNPDVLIPQAIAEGACELLDNALVAPPIAYGYKSQQQSGGGNHLPGTTSLDGDTLTQTVRDVIKEFARHGSRQVVLMNGHYENSMFVVEGIDLALRELGWGGIHDMKVMILSYWDFVTDATIEALYPQGFTGWDIEHGGVLETSLMLHLYPHLVDMSKVVDHPPAEFPAYDMFPVEPNLTPASGTLSSAKQASAEKGLLLFGVCSSGIANAVKEKFQSNSAVLTSHSYVA
ncbi:MAG TPA: creatininase [Oceanospirillaceae bacterium]|nr:creatininase [Oceanospirillaceae bacterium]